jgi:hypothetical protein
LRGYKRIVDAIDSRNMPKPSKHQPYRVKIAGRPDEIREILSRVWADAAIAALRKKEGKCEEQPSASATRRQKRIGKPEGLPKEG